MVLENTTGKMEVSTKGNSTKVKSMAMGSGVKAIHHKNTKANSFKTKKKVTEYTVGTMAISIKATINLI
jgi:hypothetical protein